MNIKRTIKTSTNKTGLRLKFWLSISAFILIGAFLCFSVESTCAVVAMVALYTVNSYRFKSATLHGNVLRIESIFGKDIVKDAGEIRDLSGKKYIGHVQITFVDRSVYTLVGSPSDEIAKELSNALTQPR